MKHTVFVDGQAGTTGLQIEERLSRRTDVELLRIPHELRKDIEARRELLNAADVAFLCLPDDAARESVALVSSSRTRIIDASTAHRTDPAWAYGLPELSRGQREKISQSKRISVPGCHATGFVLALRPLVDAGMVPPDYPVACHSVTGYSGGGHALMDAYQAGTGAGKGMEAARHYALALRHKHVPEMRLYGGLSAAPLFTPIIGNFERGMAVAFPFVLRTLSPGTAAAAGQGAAASAGSAQAAAGQAAPASAGSGASKRQVSLEDIHRILAARYDGARFVRVMPLGDASLPEAGYFDPTGCNGTNCAELYVFGNEEQALVICRLDNLGKGASGAAMQCMNLALGLDEGEGLE
jgi:N-acetyl-gamma-glutamyl-phosphate reductase